jgi:hypothetical protein
MAGSQPARSGSPNPGAAKRDVPSSAVEGDAPSRGLRAAQEPDGVLQHTLSGSPSTIGFSTATARMSSSDHALSVVSTPSAFRISFGSRPD